MTLKKIQGFKDARVQDTKYKENLTINLLPFTLYLLPSTSRLDSLNPEEDGNIFGDEQKIRTRGG
jgi:hypothetical protein